MNRYLKYFLRPIHESRDPKISCVTEDDLNFLEAIGNYMYDKRTNKTEAANALSVAIKKARKRSELFDELQAASQDRLQTVDAIFAEVDTSKFNEEDISNLKSTSCNWMGNLMCGTIDESMLESGNSRAIGQYPFESENTLLYMPVVEKWLNTYLEESEHSISTLEFLKSVKEALGLEPNNCEVIAEHSPDNIGQIIYTK